MIYDWKDGARQHLDPQVVGERLERIETKHGFLTAELVVKDARPVRSPLHDGFEWDDRTAADQWRLEQARDMMRSVVVVMEATDSDPGRTVRAFVQVEERGGRHYLSTTIVLSDAELRVQFLRAAKRELESFERRYQEFEELAEVLAAARKFAAAS